MIPDINLMPKVDQQAKSNKVLFIIMGLLACVFLGVLGWIYLLARSDVAELKERLMQAEEQKVHVQTELDLVQSSNEGSLEEAITFVERVSYPVSPIIDELQSLLPQSTYLRTYSFTETATSIVIDFETMADIAIYVERLENSPFFIDSQVGTVAAFEAKSEEKTATDFTKVPRYSTNIQLLISETYLATGGGTE